MNKNKIIFGIIGVVIVILLFWIVLYFNGTKDKPKDTNAADFTIWTYNLDKEKLSNVIKEFKSKNKSYESKNIQVENFSNYLDYKETLHAAIISGKGPDIFLLNNFEKSFLENHVAGINPSIINPNDFRKNYKTFMVDDLIRKGDDAEGKKVDYVLGIPVGYETLGIYYNRKFNIKSSDLSSWAGVSNIIETIKERNPDVVPLGIMNGSINNNPDVLTQFFMLGDSTPISFEKVTELGIKDAFENYYSNFNNENIKTESDTETSYYDNDKSSRINLKLFSEGNEAMIIGYTSMINSLEESGFNNSFLFAEPFPHYFSGKGKTLARYNYFVVNQDTKNEGLAFDLLTYLSSKDGAKIFLNNFTYLLPALVTLEQDKIQEKIHTSYNLTLGDFYKPENDSLLSSFDKGITSLYDEKMTLILQDDNSFLDQTKKLQKTIICKYKKIFSLEGLSTNCEE